MMDLSFHANFQVTPFKTQARNFKKVTAWLRLKLGSSDSKTLLSNAVYMFSIGSNDYLSPILTNSNVLKYYSHSQYVSMVVGNFTSTVKVQIFLYFNFFYHQKFYCEN
jgi:hypothetical protein